MAKKGRGWISSIDRLPVECQPVVAWASRELAKTDRTQIDIYKEFEQRLQQIKDEHGIQFTVPHYRSFNRYSVQAAELSTAVEQAQHVARVLTKRFDAAGSDDLMAIAAEAIKALTLEAAMRMVGTGEFDGKTAREFGSALRQLAAVEAHTANLKQKREAEDRLRVAEAAVQQQTAEAVNQVAKQRGLTAETANDILSQILGVEKT